MSIVFTPSIPESLRSNDVSAKPKAPRRSRRKPWLPKDLTALIELRALAVPHRDIGLILRRRPEDCSGAVHRHNLQLAIRIRRKRLIGAVHA